jgi:NADPH-dependent 2,4-dienoyl-CoA reductase/sulfur reductase-like enzyme
MKRPLSIVVVGGGIGGLASAIALGRAGHSVRVFERASELAQPGHGITIWSNAMRVLRVLGLADAVVAAGCPIESGEFCDRRGRVLVRTPVGAVARELGEPCVGITRDDLQRGGGGPSRRRGRHPLGRARRRAPARAVALRRLQLLARASGAARSAPGAPTGSRT